MTSAAPTDLQQLIRAARVQGLSQDATLPSAIRTLIGAADQAQRQLTDQELLQICAASDADHEVANQLQHRADALVDEARRRLLNAQPDLVKPGGALHPSERAAACWRDCWQFFRVIVYSYVCCRPDFTDPAGMAALRQLYEQMNVPVLGLNIALEQMEILSVAEITDADAQAALIAAFRHLQTELNKTVVKS